MVHLNHVGYKAIENLKNIAEVLGVHLNHVGYKVVSVQLQPLLLEGVHLNHVGYKVQAHSGIGNRNIGFI